MKTFGIVLLASTSLLNGLSAHDARADDAVNVLVSSEFISQLVEEARTNNPALKAVDARLNAAEFDADAVRTWEDPMAMVGGSVYSSRGMDPSEEGDITYGLQQKLPAWDRPKLERNVARVKASLGSAELDYRYQQLRHDITKALLDAALAERVVEFGGQDSGWLNAAVTAVESKYRTGQASIADTLQIQNEAAERDDLQLTGHRRLAHARVALNRLLNRDLNGTWPQLQLPDVAPVVPYSAKLVSLALASEPRLQVMARAIEQAEVEADLTRKSRLPDMSLGIEAQQYSGDGEFRSGMFTFGFSLPWVNRDNYRQDYYRDREQLESARQEREDQVLMVRESLHHLTVDIEALRREALLYRDEIGPRAAQALSSRLADWEAGHGALREVLDSRRVLLDSQLKAASALAEQRQAVTELLLWTGLENAEALESLTNEPSITPEHETDPI